MDSEQKAAIKAEWEVLIGRFSILMGEIELHISQLLMLLGSSTRGFLNERLNRLAANVGRLDANLADPCLRCIDEARRLKDLRNEVLHSALNIYVGFEGIPVDATVSAEDVEGRETYIGSRIISFDERKSSIDLGGMRALVTDTKKLSDELNWMVLAQAFSEDPDGLPKPPTNVVVRTQRFPDAGA